MTLTVPCKAESTVTVLLTISENRFNTADFEYDMVMVKEYPVPTFN